ncbi:MAG: pimeloyl-ACP methyl ester carboxylesterase, partial [Glaciecola sp.]
PWVAVVGVSMGGTSAVHSLTLADGPDAVVAISAPAYLHAEPRTAPMARLHLLWTSPRHRLGMRAVTGVRVVPVAQWESPPHPADVVARSTTPVLLVHGQDDPYFGVEEWEPIALQHGIPLWAEPVGFGHAEDGLTPAFARRVAGAVHSVWRTGQFPERDERPG